MPGPVRVPVAVRRSGRVAMTMPMAAMSGVSAMAGLSTMSVRTAGMTSSAEARERHGAKTDGTEQETPDVEIHN